MEKPVMRLTRPIAEDSFERARKEFFGTGKTPEMNGSPAEFLEPDGTVVKQPDKSPLHLSTADSLPAADPSRLGSPRSTHLNYRRWVSHRQKRLVL